MNAWHISERDVTSAQHYSFNSDMSLDVVFGSITSSFYNVHNRVDSLRQQINIRLAEMPVRVMKGGWFSPEMDDYIQLARAEAEISGQHHEVPAEHLSKFFRITVDETGSVSMTIRADTVHVSKKS